MSPFFRKIRKQLAANNKTLKYLRYAVSEIVLVVVGILIALQVNNWNEERKKMEQFNFGLREVYNQIKIKVFEMELSIDRAKSQILYIDSILAGKVVHPNHLPGIIQILDVNIELQVINTAQWSETYLQFNPNKPRQNDLARFLRRYLQSKESNANIMAQLKLDNVMMNYLREWNIPIRFDNPVDGFQRAIENFPDDLYTDKNLEDVRNLLRDESFVADLKTLKTFRKLFLQYSDVYKNLDREALKYLEQYDPDLHQQFENIEIIGTGTERNSWALGFPMENVSEDDGAWALELNLEDGEVKFRSDGNWTFDWGKSELDVQKLIFRGSNIPVHKGRYLVRINIYENSYEIRPIAETEESE